MRNKRKYLILGCGGFIGSHLLDKLLPAGRSTVYGFDVDTQKIGHHLDNPNFSFWNGDLRTPSVRDAAISVIDEVDSVINLAAICNPSLYNTRPLDTIQSNFLDVYELVEVCSDRNTWLIHFSTSEIYGRTISSYVDAGSYSDEDLYELDELTTPLVMGPISNQRWSYACAKQLLERFIFAHHKERGLPFTIVRPLNFFGPRMDFIPGRDGEGIPRVLGCFVAALLDKKPMLLVDGGGARRTIVSIHDAIRAILMMLENPVQAQNQIFNIGNRDNEVTIAELADLMRKTYAEVSGDDSYRQHPIRSIAAVDFYGEGYEDCDRRMPKIECAKSQLGWEPVISLKDTIRETLEYYHRLYGRAVRGTRQQERHARTSGGSPTSPASFDQS